MRVTGSSQLSADATAQRARLRPLGSGRFRSLRFAPGNLLLVGFSFFMVGSSGCFSGVCELSSAIWTVDA